MAGGLVAGLVLASVGGELVVYEVVFPFVMVTALAAGPLLGVVAGQAMFTLLVAMLFAQIAPVSWRLAEVRILDVVLGGLLGAVVGLLVWPRGAQGEMRRTAKAALDAAANDLESTVRSLTHTEAASSDRQDAALSQSKDTAGAAVHFLMLTDSTYAQYRSELRNSPDPVDWLSLLGLVNEVVRGGQALRRTHGTAGPLPWAGVAANFDDLAAGTADQLRALGGLLGTKASGGDTSPKASDHLSVDSWISTSEGREVARRQSDPAAAVRILDVWGWLAGVSFDSRRVSAGIRSSVGSR
jgi:uncharacterized membrane protein YccC